MAVLHLICGLPGSGKSTLARQLELQEGAIWLSPDEWMRRIVGDGFDERRRQAIEDVQWDLSKKLLTLEVSVVLDNGFWSRDERIALRAEAQALGAQIRLHVLDIPLTELQDRIANRNRSLPINCFPISASDLESWSELFEPPGPDEQSAS